ncbi:hypothetical protein DNK10_14160 [Pseudomonas daroniae]|nr:hypothetical protein DNK10_14160 [Pseudomonas daroniae]
MFSTAIGQYFCQFLTLVILARLLTPSDFGVVSAAAVLLSFLKIFSEIGVGPAIVQREVLSNRDIRTAKTLSFILALLLCGLMMFLAQPVSAFFSMPELKDVLQCMAFLLPIGSLSVVGMSLMQREMDFKKISLINLFSYMLGYFVVATPMAFMGFGIWSLVCAYLIQSLSQTLFVLLIVRRAPGYSFDLASSKSMLHYGVGISLSRTGNFFANQIDNIIVGRYMGAEALGLYGRAYQLMIMPAMLVGGIVEKILFPVMSEAQNRSNELSDIFVRSLGLVIMLVLPVSVLISVLAEEIVWVLLGEQWVAISYALRILAISLVFRISYKICEPLVHAKSAVYGRAWREFLYAAFVLVGCWLGHYWGITGVAFGVAAAVFFHFILMMNLSCKVLDFSMRCLVGKLLRFSCLSLVVGVLLYLIKYTFLILGFSHIVILTACVLFFILVVLVLFFWTPDLLGDEGRLIKSTIGSRFKKKTAI